MSQTQLNESLICAAEDGDSYEVQMLLELGAELGYENYRALRQAARFGRLEVVEFFLRRGADPNAKEAQAFRKAAGNGHFKVAAALLSAGAEEMVSYLAKREFSSEMIHTTSSENIAAAEGSLNYDLIIASEDGASEDGKLEKALFSAIEQGHLDVVKLLVERGADIRAREGEAVYLAVNNERLSVLQYLFERGLRMREGTNYLKIAVERNNIAIVSCLLQNGADLHADDDFAVLRASDMENLALIRFLLQRGGNPAKVPSSLLEKIPPEKRERRLFDFQTNF